MSSVALALQDGVVVGRRNLIKITRVPEILVWITMSPIMFVLLFSYVFGSMIEVPGTTYREFLMAGIFTQTVIFGATFTGASLAEDMTKGIIDRFRSLPMARSAVIVGRTGADIFYNLTSLVLMTATGLVVGWRIHTGFVEAAGGYLLFLAFAFAISWIMAYVGLKVSSVEVVNNASFMFIFPMTFIANTFVVVSALPGPLRTFAEWNPVSAVAQAGREAFGNTGSVSVDGAWSLENPIAYTLIWVAIILAVFVPLSIRQYNKAASRA